MKILAKERLLARQLPPELDQLAYKSARKSITDYMKYLGIDLNNTPYEEVSNKDAKKIIKQTNRLGCLLCFFRKYVRDDYEYALLTAYKDADTNRTKISLDLTSLGRNPGSISSIIDNAKKIYFFKGNEQTRKRLEELRQERRENKVSDFEKRFSEDERGLFTKYDKSGYLQRNPKARLAVQRLDKAAEKSKKCLENIISITVEEVSNYLNTFAKQPNKWYDYNTVSYRIGDAVRNIDSTFEDACKNIGGPYAAKYHQLYALGKEDRNNIDNLDLEAAFVNFMYSVDISRLLQEYRSLVVNRLKR